MSSRVAVIGAGSWGTALANLLARMGFAVTRPSAASQTVEEARHVHSMHGYFLRPGDAALPVVYQVDRVRDGGSFSTRRVTAIQKGNPIFTCSASGLLNLRQAPKKSAVRVPGGVLRGPPVAFIAASNGVGGRG